MAEAAVSVLVEQIMGTLTYLIREEFSLLWGFKDSVMSIKDDFDLIEAFLEDAENMCSQYKAVELWLRRLRSVSLEIENVLDEILTKALRQRLRNERGIIYRCQLVFRLRKERGIKYRIRAFFSSNQLVFRHRMAQKVKDIKNKLDTITLQSQRFGLRLTPSSSVKDTGAMPDRETSSHIHDSSSIFGRDKEVEEVTKKICNNDNRKYDNGEILVYGIYGMGGLGKTTLAQLVYNLEEVNQYFELKSWVYVSEKFHFQEIIKGIIESIDKCECKLTRLDLLQETLQDKLRGKKFLVVLDDVWIEEDEKPKWEKLSETLSCGEEGSIVLMTTRSKTTCEMMAKVSEWQHELGCLSEDDSWLLFTKFAFAQGRVGDDMSLLEPIGKKIIEKCQRLPLAVKTLGSLLWSKRSETEWEHVKSSIQWQLQESKVLPALKLSYDNLLPHLKRCFAYCCLFPKGYKMEKDVVIQLWVSNGFIPPRGEIDLYVLGEESFNCLLWRSFFQVEIDRYKMHDLMHDMAADVMRHDCLVVDPECKDVKIQNEVLHLSSSCPDFLFSPQELQNPTQLRSLLMLGRNNNIRRSRISQIFNHVYLRVLYLPGIDSKTLPESICNLKLLKFLYLRGSGIVVLPESIIYLQKLQVLVLYGCSKLSKLPEGLRSMRGLQHLDIRICRSLQHLPIGVKELTSLRRLLISRFEVGKERGAKIEELGHPNYQLEGELEIRGLENVEGLSEAKSANLKSKTNLLLLRLMWPHEVSESEMVKHEEVLEGLEPNVCLERLEIYNYIGKISPSWMVSSTNLVHIEFRDCKKCEHIPALGRLTNLRFIRLESMGSLKSFHDNDKSMLGGTTDMFLSLQELIIFQCPNLVSLPSNLPSIRKLHLSRCDKLLSLPDKIQSFKDLKQLNIYHCKHLSESCEKEKGVDWPKISHIPNINM